MDLHRVNLVILTTWSDFSTGFTYATDYGFGVDMDYKKAFNSVPHHRLLYKLNKYDICDRVHQRIPYSWKILRTPIFEDFGVFCLTSKNISSKLFKTSRTDISHSSATIAFPYMYT